jgi:hypothetical protein
MRCFCAARFCLRADEVAFSEGGASCGMGVALRLSLSKLAHWVRLNYLRGDSGAGTAEVFAEKDFIVKRKPLRSRQS